MIYPLNRAEQYYEWATSYALGVGLPAVQNLESSIALHNQVNQYSQGRLQDLLGNDIIVNQVPPFHGFLPVPNLQNQQFNFDFINQDGHFVRPQQMNLEPDAVDAVEENEAEEVQVSGNSAPAGSSDSE